MRTRKWDSRSGVQLRHRPYEGKAGTHSPLGIMLVRMRVTKVNQHAS
jgi:hypothetical protein